MVQRQFPILPILLMVAIAGIAFYVYQHTEWVDKDFPISRSSEARQNRLLAAQRLLEADGFSVEQFSSQREFVDINVETTGVLLIPDLNAITTYEEQQAISRWVRDGGVLLASHNALPETSETTPVNTLLEGFGIQAIARAGDESIYLWEIRQDNEESASANANNNTDTGASGDNSDESSESMSYQADDTWDEDRELFQLTLPGDTPVTIELSTRFIPLYRNVKPPLGVTPVIEHPQIKLSTVDNGSVMIYAEDRMFDNDRIGELDQPYFLAWLAQQAKTTRAGIVFNLKPAPGIIGTLWAEFPLLLILLGVVTLAYLRLAASRWGPIEREIPALNSNLIAHLRARGEFWDRHRQSETMLAPLREAVLSEVVQRPGSRSVANSLQAAISAEDSRAEIDRAASLSGCSTATAERALYGPITNNKHLIECSEFFYRVLHRQHRVTKDSSSKRK